MKNVSERNKNLFLWISCFLLLLLPSVYHAWWFSMDTIPFLITGIVSCALIVSAMLWIPWRVVRWLAFSVLFVITLFELAHMMVYDGDISSAGYVRSLFMTTPYEADGALGRVIKQHVGFIVFLTVFYLLASLQLFLVTPQTKRTPWIFSVSGMVLVIHLLINPSALVSRPPIHIYVQMAEAWHQRCERNRFIGQAEGFSYHSYRQQPSINKEVYVLVLDESLRYDHVSLDGVNYRVTMPRIGRLNNLVSYTDYVTSGVFTMYAVPMLVTRATPSTFVLNYTEKGIQQAFAEVGFKSIWLTNEAQLVSDGVSDYVARGADIIRVQRDMDMPAVVDSLCETTDKLFIIMHLWGNHQFYLNTSEATSLYYPDITTTDDVHGEQMYNNSYDNAILYTDSMLMALTEVLQSKSCIAHWIFTSDHGEGPIGHNGGAHGYTQPSSGEYHVPLIVWYSDLYTQIYPEKVANVIKHRDQPVSADHIFWSLLDVANLQIDSAMEQEFMSIYADSLSPYPRMLLLSDGKNTELIEEINGGSHQ